MGPVPIILKATSFLNLSM